MSMISCVFRSHVSISTILSRNGFAYGDPFMVWDLMMWSSIRPCISSTVMELTMYVSVSFQSLTSKSNGCHCSSIDSRVVSSEYSRPAESEICCSSSSRVSTSMSMTRDSVNAWSRSMAKPTASEMSSQWRCRRPGLHSAWTSGRCCLNASRSFFTFFATPAGIGRLIDSNSDCSFMALFAMVCAAWSTASGSMEKSGPRIHFFSSLVNLYTSSQRSS
mmetsp:Transcript_30419/g.77435  ORF Transcript_30419/g.77435 Transcript_30419/m.77435 type:complete len:218 (+) Transcript_30419:972-1625(+)